MVSIREEALDGRPAVLASPSGQPKALRLRRAARYVAARWRSVPRPARQVCVAAFGGAVLLVGVAMIVLPGPAVVVIPLGFAILASEFHWAAKLVTRAKAKLTRLKRAALSRKTKSAPRPPANEHRRLGV